MKRLMTAVCLLTIVTVAPLAQSPSLVVTEGIVEGSPDDVWKAFTTKDGIESWMVAKTDIDLRVGGTWRTSYNKESTLDDDTSIHQQILALDAPRMLAFKTVNPPKNFPFPAAIAQTWTVVYFEPVAEARTKVTIRMLGFGADPDSQRMRGFFERGNRQTLDSLTKRQASARDNAR